jgi:putative peptidoglycan lipid II flippase
LAACLNASLLYWQLRKQDIFQPLPGWALFLTKLVIAVLMMSAVLLGMLWLMPAWDQGNMLARLLRLALVVVVGVLVYFSTLGLLGFRPKDFARRSV